MCNMYKTIEQLCTHKGIKPGKMCADLEISRGVIGDLKAGRTKKLSAENLRKISEYFSVPVDYLLNGVEVETTPTKSGEQGDALDSTESSRRLKLLARHLNRIPEETRNRLINNFEDTIDTYLDAMGIPRESEDS